MVTQNSEFWAMETLDSAPFQLLPPSSPCSNHESRLTGRPTLTPTTVPSSVTRLWRPAAQRNIRNQWSKLASYRQKWVSTSSSGRSHATSLVNAYLSQRYMHAMELGVLSDMPDIRNKAYWKFFKQQELHRSKLFSSYKDLVTIVIDMINSSRSMRCYLIGPSGSPLIQFSSSSEDKNDFGDGRGIPVYTFWAVSYFEILAQELFQIFALELNLKRYLVMELLSISCEEVPPLNRLCWSDELYPGEFDDLSLCNLYSKETSQPLLPRIEGGKAELPGRSNNQPDHGVLEFYLITWLSEVNINTHRVDEIFDIIEEEMHVKIS